MSKCPTLDCGESLLPHSRRKYCAKCRSRMGWWAQHKTQAERVLHVRRLNRNMFRMAHLDERKEDQQEALARLRAAKRKNQRR
jgi:hypothetical protein